MSAKVINNEEMLDELFALSAFCIEGVMASPENIDWLESELALDETNNPIYVCYGSMINHHFELTGENAYPADYPFIFIYDYYDVEKRIELGAQWFDVIIEKDLIEEVLAEQSEEVMFVDE